MLQNHNLGLLTLGFFEQDSADFRNHPLPIPFPELNLLISYCSIYAVEGEMEENVSELSKNELKMEPKAAEIRVAQPL